ncbi:MAG TPA: sensor histidine kinase [Desertimonas sp.]|nr:sensor histidine kinase [Desertimonas sp.]
MNGSSLNPLRPWRHPLRLWLTMCFNVTAIVVAAITFTLIIAFVTTSFGLLITFVIAIPFVWVTFVLSRGFARFERGRIAALAAVRIVDPVPPLTAATWWGRLKERVRSKPRWREIAYHLAHLPVAAITYALTMAAWCGSMAMVLLPLYVDSLPGDSAKFHFFEITQGAGAAAAAAVGVIGVAVVAPWVTIGLEKVNVALARALLGQSADAAHAAQVERLETSRTAAVDSAEAERRRIERDLHDGAQQRLVALAAGLGAAREKIDADPEEGRRMLADAHEEAKSALKEIRDLVRGIHPVILEDRGLDAALSAVVARSAVPVTLDVQLNARPPAAVESAAYFVVNEALTNIAKHANATRAHVSIARAGDRLVVEVRDNGRGGAEPAAGTGLQGLRDRVAGLGGSMYVISPAGGPTTISVELPCAS